MTLGRRALHPASLAIGLAAVMLCGLVAVSSPVPPVAADGNEAPGSPQEFRSITAGRSHTCAITRSGEAKCWGYNNVGQLGQGDTANRGDQTGEMGQHLPAIDLGTGRTVTAISAGDYHTCALLDSGQVKCWGNSFAGVLGLGGIAGSGDRAGGMGDNLPAVDLGTGRTATAIVSGSYSNCALLDDGSVRCWGLNDNGQLGVGDRSARGDQPGEMGDSLPPVLLGSGHTATAITMSGQQSGGGTDRLLAAHGDVGGGVSRSE